MEAIRALQSKARDALEVLNELTHAYGGMDDTLRIEKSNFILDDINSYLQIKGNLLLPSVRRANVQGETEALLQEAEAVDSAIKNLIEHILQLHVDEPGGEYYNDLLRLSKLVAQASQADETRLLPWLEAHLNATEQARLDKHLKAQMTHESLPSTSQLLD